MLKKIYSILSCILLSCLLLSACTDNNNEVELNRKVLPIAETEGGGISYGLYNLEGKIESTDIFNMDRNEKFNRILSAANYYEYDIDFSMVILVDFMQTDFKTEGKEKASFYDFTVKAGEAEQVEFSISDLEEGNHNVNILLFRDLDNHSLENEFRKATDFSNFITYSCLLQVGQGAEDLEKYNFSEVTETKENTTIDAIALNQEENAFSLCSSLSLEEARESFYIHVGNTGKDEKKYAIVLFDGKQVIPINGEMATFISLKAESMADIKFSIKELDKSQIHELTAVRFVMNEGRGETIRVDNSSRIGINLK